MKYKDIVTLRQQLTQERVLQLNGIALSVEDHKLVEMRVQTALMYVPANKDTTPQKEVRELNEDTVKSLKEE